jgi:hypothetical protein
MNIFQLLGSMVALLIIRACTSNAAAKQINVRILDAETRLQAVGFMFGY